jgi:DNA-binding MarR family transcriptional regulator
VKGKTCLVAPATSTWNGVNLVRVTVEPVPWLTENEQHVWRLLLAVESRLRDRLDSELRTIHDVSLGDYAVLVNLSEAAGQALRMSELADRLVISRSGLTRRVDAMERRGLVRRRPCPEDGRGSMAELTSAGFDLLRRAAPTHVAGVRRYLVDVLGDLDGLAQGLSRIEKALG